jgi:hypothetical protein
MATKTDRLVPTAHIFSRCIALNDTRNSAFLEDAAESLRQYFETCSYSALEAIIKGHKDLSDKQKECMIWVLSNPNRINEMTRAL